MFGFAPTISLPRKSKRLFWSVKSFGIESPVAEQCLRIRYVGIVSMAVAPAATALEKANLKAAPKKVLKHNLIGSPFGFPGVKSIT